MSSRIQLQAVPLTAALLCSACWGAQQQLAPPELGEQRAEVAQTIERLERISATVDDEIIDLRDRSETFFSADASTWLKPFPLDSFKHTAMSCLNAPYNQEDPEPTVSDVAERFGVSCAVPAALDLEERTAAAPGQRPVVTEQLRNVDQLRNVRVKIQSRLRQLPSIVRRTRSYLSSRRAEARQMSKDIEARRADYGRKGFEEAMDRIEDYEDRLVELDRAIDVVEGSEGRWSKELGNVVDALYKNLSRLGRQ